MIIECLERAPLLRSDVDFNGMVRDADGNYKPGRILELWVQLRKRVGVVALKKKNGMKFETRAATDTYDQVREAADELGILIYPHEGKGEGKVVDSGTLCDVTLNIICQAIEDGSCISIFGYGQGADTQDKAGGKAGTYAFKQALIQACLAGGAKTPKKDRIPDTDDTDEPIPGGVKARSAKPSQQAVEEALKAAENEPQYRAAVDMLKQLAPEAQVAIKPVAMEAKARCVPAKTSE
jgi:hypothetical protein